MTKLEISKEANRRVVAMLADDSRECPTPWEIAKAASEAMDKASDAATEAMRLELKSEPSAHTEAMSCIATAGINAHSALRLVLWHREHGSLE